MGRISTVFLVLAFMLCSGCKRGGSGEGEGAAQEVLAVDAAPGPQTNRLDGLPGEVYRSQEGSRINWQPWTKETFRVAKDSRRLVLAVIALPQQPSFADVIGELEASDAIVEEINRSYVPVLVDGDAVREIGILTADLCAEVGSGLQLPLMVWMTPDADPVAWIPLPPNQSESIPELFSQSHEMVGRMWNEDPGYVSKNSTMDQGNRKQRLVERRKEREMSVEPAADSLRALRQLTSLYDPVSRTFDEAGGLFPCGAIDLLSMGLRCEGIPADLKENCGTVLGYLLDDLLVSPMFDPLDGGVFSSRRGSTWALPGFYRDCSIQARVAVSLFDAYEAGGDRRALERALDIMEFIESEYATADGLYSLGTGLTGDTRKWLWNVDDLKKILTAEEFSLWVEASGMSEMGNLPSEVDPLREFFRENSIAFVKSGEELVKLAGGDEQEVEALLDSARRKLLKVRRERMGNSMEVPQSNAAATFRVVSANASAYRITGDRRYLEKAVETLTKAKEFFAKGPELLLYRSEAEGSLVAGRAFLYALALQAALDVAAVSFEEAWLMWADDLATTAAELFAVGDYLRECPEKADLMDLPISDMAMLFDESSTGLFSMAESRLNALGRPLLKPLSALVGVLPMAAINSPILHTDIVQGVLMREYGTTYVYGPGISGETKDLLSRMPLKGVNLRAARDENGAGGEGLLKIRAGKKAEPVEESGGLEVPALRITPK